MVEKCNAPKGECPQAEQAADHAVRKVFAILGEPVERRRRLARHYRKMDLQRTARSV